VLRISNVRIKKVTEMCLKKNFIVALNRNNYVNTSDY